QQVQALQMALREEEALTDKDEEIRFLRVVQQAGEAEISRQKVTMWALALGILGILVAGFFILRSYRSRQRANRLLALRSLRSQMNPHFIFNSLNSVNSFISKNDERSANKYLSDFSRLMRSVMEHSSHDFVPLTEELRVLELYLSLEHFRFQNKFEYSFEVDPAIDATSIEIPPMLVQPYIENSIWHGLRYKEEMGFLKVSFVQEGKQLVAIVEDNGIGRKRSMEIKTKNQKAHTSTGLKNTAQRLELINSLYKTRMSVKIEDLNTEAQDVGTRVRIVIPYHELG
ncbi:histidine kinase, partial [bacterium]|nr:histidine kinase [bacterium]